MTLKPLLILFTATLALGAAQAQTLTVWTHFQDESLGWLEGEVAGFQAAFIEAIRRVVHDVPEGRGLGVFYWEPTWLPVEGAGWRSGEGNAWENQALFDFQGNALASLRALGAPLTANQENPKGN